MYAGLSEGHPPPEEPGGWRDAGLCRSAPEDVTELFGAQRSRKVYAMTSKLFLGGSHSVWEGDKVTEKNTREAIAEIIPEKDDFDIVRFNLSSIPQSNSVSFSPSNEAASEPRRPGPIDEGQFVSLFLQMERHVWDRDGHTVVVVVNCTHGRNRSGAVVARLLIRALALRKGRPPRRREVAGVLTRLAEQHRRRGGTQHGGVTDPDHIVSVYMSASFVPLPGCVGGGGADTDPRAGKLF